VAEDVRCLAQRCYWSRSTIRQGGCDVSDSSTVAHERSGPGAPEGHGQHAQSKGHQYAPYLGETKLTIGEPVWKRLDTLTVEKLVGQEV
jgi:hypothetical protein